MREHTDQVAHNLALLKALDKQFPTDYFDWKVTIVFYTALHGLRAYEKFKKVRIAKGHKFLYEHSDPTNPNAVNPISQRAFDAYNLLHDASTNTRYQGVVNPVFRKSLLEIQYKEALLNWAIVKNHLVAQGLTL